ncbi:MAG: manganese ABC transporter ATP-binding protein [Chlamydiae bacterium CG10_big_fil_rev_8_21_14_0_10_42_34]|nr:MAG: manganese ABC transporter ATP-binding protein [Chlamydiae bacterium CG10_big_fil_rev_8_21_14_0_10_42_34]
MEYAVRAEGLNINFGNTSILWDLSFEIPKGSLVGIIGPNGAGKSTLLKAALGLVKPFSGKISLYGNVAYVPQRESVDWDFPITAKEVVLMGRYGRLGLFGRLRKADRLAAAAALEQVGMSAYADRQISQLSGGQQQRLFIARALVQDADLFLLDEPFVGVDLATEKAIVQLLQKLKEQGKTILIVHHDLPSVEEYFDWVLLLNTRLLGCAPVKEVFTRENLARAFGKSQLLFDEAVDLSAKSTSGIL